MPILDNPKHEIFAQNVARGKPQIEAYTIAGYEQNGGNPSTLAQVPTVAARIKEIQRIVAARASVSAERVLAELARIGFADITSAIQVVDGKVTIANTAELGPDITAAIAEIRQGRDGVAVKFHDKRAALENLGKHLGLFKENIDLNVNVSLADLVNGSYRLERGDLTAAPAAIEHQAAPAAIEHQAAPADASPILPEE